MGVSQPNSDVICIRVPPKLLADSFAKKGGFLTVVPDMFGRTALPVWIMDAVGALMKKKKPDNDKNMVARWR